MPKSPAFTPDFDQKLAMLLSRAEGFVSTNPLMAVRFLDDAERLCLDKLRSVHEAMQRLDYRQLTAAAFTEA